MSFVGAKNLGHHGCSVLIDAYMTCEFRLACHLDHSVFILVAYDNFDESADTRQHVNLRTGETKDEEWSKMVMRATKAIHYVVGSLAPWH